MKQSIILAEKPSVARDIARVLNCTNKKDGYIEGKQYIVTWALGHLVTLSDPEGYHKQYQTWRLEDLPIIPKRMKLRVIPKTRKQYETVKKLLLRPNINEIIIATDAGREGELVARWIIEMARVKKPIKRLWISSVTDKAIRDGFKKLQPGEKYLNLYKSAYARSIADWVVGINATRALTTKFNAQLSCGRVQTPTLALIQAREETIKQFKPKTYYGLKAYTQGIVWTWTNKKNQNRSFNEDFINQLETSIQGKSGTITDIKTQKKRIPAPKLYDLTELQRDAHNRYQFSAKETLRIMQSLYEHHKIVTYPRTDSRYLTNDIIPTIKERLDAVRNKDNERWVQSVLKAPIQANRLFVDDSKVTDHHAIIPTEERPNYLKLSPNERKIYDLIVNRFIAVLLPHYTYDDIQYTLKIDEETFTANGKQNESLGWKGVYQTNTRDDDDHQVLPPLTKGTTLTIRRLEKTTGETKPPAYFTEATLLSAMENPRPFMTSTNQQLLKTIGEAGGLGTVATRADIIEKLFNNGLIEKKGQAIFTTVKGKQLLDLVPEAMKSPELTARWEQKLIQIEQGKLSDHQFLKDIYVFAKENVQLIKNSKQTFKHDNLTGKPCPNCEKYLLEVKRKDRVMLVCQDRNCGYRKTISQRTNARCPNCYKRLELVGEGDNQTFICVCGHREKLSTFKKRKATEKKAISKHEARRLIEKENKQQKPLNTALFDALKNLKINNNDRKK